MTGTPRLDVGGEGAARELLSALHNLHALLHSPRVGPKVVEPLLPEIRRRITDLAKRALFTVEPLGLTELSAAIRDWEARLLGALDAAARQHVDARTRLGLEATIAEVAPRIDSLREAVDIRIRTSAPPLELLLGSLLFEALAAPASTRPFGEPLRVRALPEGDGTLGVLAPPRVTLSVASFALAFAADGMASTPGTAPDVPTIGLRAFENDDHIVIVASVTRLAATHTLVLPAPTLEARTLLFAPAGPLSVDREGSVSFALRRAAPISE
jgi:hypothetical protein